MDRFLDIFCVILGVLFVLSIFGLFVLFVYDVFVPCVIDHNLPKNGLFCSDCGIQLRKSCPVCDFKPISLGVDYCAQCGFQFEVTADE